MFDFFLETSEFNNQVVGLLNFGITTINNFLGQLSDCQPLQAMIQTVNAFPAPFPALFSAVFAAGIFEYIRGR